MKNIKEQNKMTGGKEQQQEKYIGGKKKRTKSEEGKWVKVGWKRNTVSGWTVPAQPQVLHCFYFVPFNYCLLTTLC